MAKQNDENNPNIINVLNTQAAGQANKDGNKFMQLSDIKNNTPDTPGPKIIFAQPWTNKAFLNELQENNKSPENKKIYWVFGDNTQDKSEALDQTKKYELRKGVGNQAGALKGTTHEEYSKVAVGVVTTKKPQGKDLSTAFKESLEELYVKAAQDKNATFIVPAEFDKDGNLTQINIGTGIAAKHLDPESVKAMTDAVKEVLTNIAKGERQRVPNIELKPKQTFIHKAKQTFQQLTQTVQKTVQNLFKKTETKDIPQKQPKSPEKSVRFQVPVAIAEHRSPNKQKTKRLPERIAPPPRNTINPNHKTNDQGKGRQ